MKLLAVVIIVAGTLFYAERLSSQLVELRKEMHTTMSAIKHAQTTRNTDY